MPATVVAAALLGACSSSSTTKGSTAGTEGSVLEQTTDLTDTSPSAVETTDTTPREFAIYDPKWAGGICETQLPSLTTIGSVVGDDRLADGVDGAYSCVFMDAATKSTVTFSVADASSYAAAQTNGATAGALPGSLTVDRSEMIVYGGYTYVVDADIAKGSTDDDATAASTLLGDWLGL